MGGGGGSDPFSAIGSLVFSAFQAASESGKGHAQASNSAAADAASEQAAQEAAEERRRAARRKSEAELLANARQSERAAAASRDDAAQTLGAPSVAAANLKEKLGQ
jgi:uncharacterized membrane protein